jgi:hypothetical protein
MRRRQRFFVKQPQRARRIDDLDADGMRARRAGNRIVSVTLWFVC